MKKKHFLINKKIERNKIFNFYVYILTIVTRIIIIITQ